MELNLYPELGRLLEFTADVATAIRMNSPYNGAYAPCNPEHANDVLWLSDTLHKLGILGTAVRKGDAKAIEAACDRLIAAYEQYEDVDLASRSVGDRPGAFRRNERRFKLADGKAIFEDIRRKVQSARAGDAA